jgi:hypothetical protein
MSFVIASPSEVEGVAIQDSYINTWIAASLRSSQ